MGDLSDAIKAGDEARVVSLLDADPGSVSESESGVTPLMLAIYHGQRDLARVIADRSPSLSFPEVCALGDAVRAEQMLAADPSLLEVRSADGFPPLGLAVFFHHGALARWLIEQGADVNAAAENALRVAPLHAAAAACDRETARLLLARGADPHARQQMDYTALHGAASRGDVELGRLLLEHGADFEARGTDGMTSAEVAVKYGHPEWVAALKS